MATLPDHYETLQVSARADRDTIERVFRHLAKRYHPDNAESGDADHFALLMEAYRVLSDAEMRAQYDVKYDAMRQDRWRVFGRGNGTDEIHEDRQVQYAFLTILYKARRHNSDQPGIGNLELERLLGCPDEHLRFHAWYLKERGWIQRLENGQFAITAAGVDRVLENGGPVRDGLQLLKAASEPAPKAANG
jgi:curved DNA-binding protein CbpA